MLLLLLCKFFCLSYMTLLTAILDNVVQYLCEVSVEDARDFFKQSVLFLPRICLVAGPLYE